MNILKDLRFNELDSIKKRKLIKIYFSSSNDTVRDDDLVSPSLVKKIKAYLSSKGYSYIDVLTEFYMEITDDYIEIVGT